MKTRNFLFTSLLALASTVAANAQTFDIDMLKAQPVYSAEKGQGYDILAAPKAKSNAPFFYSVKVADGNYKVTVVLGSKKKAGKTVVRAENRRLMLDEVSTRKGECKTYSFIVNKRSPYINAKMNVKIKPREKDYFTWDEKLTLEFTGAAPVVKSIKVEPAPAETTTVFLCGNSTVVDQFTEPYASWGQMVTRWFGPEVAISNHAESGLTAGSFLASNRLDKVLAMMKKGNGEDVRLPKVHPASHHPNRSGSSLPAFRTQL